jgi:hypothetical protein
VHGVASLAAGWSAASLTSVRLHGSHEGTHDLAVHLRRNRICVDALAGKELASVLYAIDSGLDNVSLSLVSKSSM